MGMRTSRVITRESTPSPSPAGGPLEVHPMRADLDEGCLSISHRDRCFTMFLDLSQAYHGEFITKLRQCVQGYGFKWDELRDSEKERRQCATNFTLEVGPLYWGTAEGREKYLDPSSLKNTAELCVYPHCQEE